MKNGAETTLTDSSSSKGNLDEARDRLIAGEFAFIDGGCGIGGSIAYCEKTFGRGPGIGFDSSPGKIERARADGHPAYRADLTSIELPERCVSFLSFLDVLEHLPDIEVTRSILANMEHVARDFIFIRHPSFEDIDYLKALGLKLTWTDWHGHPNMMSLADFDALFRELGWSAPSVFGQKPILDSTHPAIVPIDAPRDSKEYDRDRHSDKPYHRFERRIHSQFDIFVRINQEMPDSEWEKIVHGVRKRRHRTIPLTGLGIR
ncbi:MAG TPA: hypothetical protein ENI85_03230 [Deltaproteobacteria bacterium]|nr:hypothetical protein [Deltaproteobacteria bacterium]